MPSARNRGSVTNDSASFYTLLPPALTAEQLRNQQAFDSNRELLSATSASTQQLRISSATMNPKAPVFTEAVIASSDRFADIAPYIGRIYNADPQKWGSILPWEFPQNGSREIEEEFLRTAFGDLECHVQDYRFLKQVWHDIAKWNFEIRVPAIAKQWLDNNKDIWTDPTLVEFVLKPSAELKTFSFTPEDVETYGEKLLSWTVKHIQYLVQLEQYKSSKVEAKGASAYDKTEHVQSSKPDPSTMKHRPAPIVVDSQPLATSEDYKRADVTKSAQLPRVLPQPFEASPMTAPIRPMPSGERLSDFAGSARMPSGLQAGSDAMHGPPIFNRKRGNSGGSRRYSNYSGGSGRGSQKWQQHHAPFALPYQHSPYGDPAFPHAAAPPLHVQQQMRILSGSFADPMPPQQPPPGFQNAGPMSQRGPGPVPNGPVGPPSAFTAGPMPPYGAVDQPPLQQNPYYALNDRGFVMDERSNGREGSRIFSGSNTPWPEHSIDSFGFNKYGGKRRESMAMRGGSGRARGGSFGGRGGKGSRGRNSFSTAGHRDSDMFADDGMFQHNNNSHHARGPPPPNGPFSSDARIAKSNGGPSLDWSRRRDKLHQENAQPTHFNSVESPPPGPNLISLQPTPAAASKDCNVVQTGTVTISTTRNESYENWISPRIQSDGDVTDSRERLELPVKLIHDPESPEAKQYPERVLTEKFIGGECTHVRKLIIFSVPPALPLEQIAAYFEDRIGAVDKVSRSQARPTMGLFDRVVHQCWITFASHLDAKRAIEMAQSALQWPNGNVLCMAVPFEYWKEDHKGYPGHEFPHLQKEQSWSCNREVKTRRWSSNHHGRETNRARAISGSMTADATREPRSRDNDGQAGAMPTDVAVPMLTMSQDSSAASRSSTTTPVASVGPTPRKKNKKPKKSKASSDVASVDSAQEAELDGSSSSNGRESLSAGNAPGEPRKTSQSSTESQFQAASEPSFSPEVIMKAQLPRIALPRSDHGSGTSIDRPTQEHSLQKVVVQKEAMTSTALGVVIEQPREDESASPTSALAAVPGSVSRITSDKMSSGHTEGDTDGSTASEAGKENRVASATQSPEKSDIDDSFHTAAHSPDGPDKHSKRDCIRDVSDTTKSTTAIASLPAQEGPADTANSDSHRAAASTRAAAGAAVMPSPPESVSLGKDTGIMAPASNAKSVDIGQMRKQSKPLTNEVPVPGPSAQRSASTLSPAPGFVTAPATPAMASSAVTPTGSSATVTSQPPKKGGKPKGPSQTESFSLYSKKKVPKPQKQKAKKGGSRIVSSATDTESVAGRVVSGISTPNVKHETQQNDHALSSQDGSSTSTSALAKQADSVVLPDSVSSVTLNGSSEPHPGATKADQHKAAEPTSTKNDTFRSAGSSDAGAQLDSSKVAQKNEHATATSSKDHYRMRTEIIPAGAGMGDVDEQPFHQPSVFRDGDEPRDSGHSGGQRDISSPVNGHSVVGLGISSAAGESLNPTDDSKSKSKKKKAKKKKKDGNGDEDSAEKDLLSVDSGTSKSISTSLPSPFAFQFTSNSPIKLSEHDDIGRISHTRMSSGTMNPPQPLDDHSDQSSQTLDGPTAQASREPTPSSTAASEPSPMKKRIELLQGRLASRSVVGAPPVRRPASAASKHARRQSSIASTKSSESLGSTSLETRRSNTRLLYLYKPKASSNRVEEIEGDRDEDNEEEDDGRRFSGVGNGGDEDASEDGRFHLLIL